jgi:hypothetical protein
LAEVSTWGNTVLDYLLGWAEELLSQNYLVSRLLNEHVGFDEDKDVSALGIITFKAKPSVYMHSVFIKDDVYCIMIYQVNLHSVFIKDDVYCIMIYQSGFCQFWPS